MSLTYSQRRAIAKHGEAAARRYDREAAAQLAAERAVVQARIKATAEARKAADAAAHRDIDSLKPGDHVRDRYGWHKVLKVNRVSVTVSVGGPWTDRIPHSKIIETRAA